MHTYKVQTSGRILFCAGSGRIFNWNVLCHLIFTKTFLSLLFLLWCRKINDLGLVKSLMYLVVFLFYISLFAHSSKSELKKSCKHLCKLCIENSLFQKDKVVQLIYLEVYFAFIFALLEIKELCIQYMFIHLFQLSNS